MNYANPGGMNPQGFEPQAQGYRYAAQPPVEPQEIESGGFGIRLGARL